MYAGPRTGQRLPPSKSADSAEWWLQTLHRVIVLCGPNHEASGSAALRTGSSALPPSPVIFMARCRSLGPTQLQIAFRVRSGKKGVRGMCTCHEEAHLHSHCTAERNHHRWSPAPGPEAPATIATSCSQGWVSVWSGVSSGREFQAPRLGDGGWGGLSGAACPFQPLQQASF